MVATTERPSENSAEMLGKGLPDPTSDRRPIKQRANIACRLDVRSSKFN